MLEPNVFAPAGNRTRMMVVSVRTSAMEEEEAGSHHQEGSSSSSSSSKAGEDTKTGEVAAATEAAVVVGATEDVVMAAVEAVVVPISRGPRGGRLVPRAVRQLAGREDTGRAMAAAGTCRVAEAPPR